jgi:signal transduction histidine kinase
LAVAPRGDHDELQAALLNLLDNALKHSPRGSTIVCRGGTGDPGHWFLAVLDSGPGIPPRERRRVFEPFYRIGGELQRTTPGTGLGLALVKRTVERHHGHIELADNPPSGTRITLVLPTHAQPTPVTNNK